MIGRDTALLPEKVPPLQLHEQRPNLYTVQEGGAQGRDGCHLHLWEVIFSGGEAQKLLGRRQQGLEVRPATKGKNRGSRNWTSPVCMERDTELWDHGHVPWSVPSELQCQRRQERPVNRSRPGALQR